MTDSRRNPVRSQTPFASHWRALPLNLHNRIHALALRLRPELASDKGAQRQDRSRCAAGAPSLTPGPSFDAARTETETGNAA
ncbi:hypothetical protein RW1_104_00060 [Rhodococcus wratislaviensis NBRC 100605]|uniref:Uncharacterized protein n=1 Tax=Rhodococcus wratislaviensis NBRC 100605 TaxID=1219028 RepID=X0Q522_RHOWR|nr:hypothetical protein RW1_104_00060 [Rhodococcus wratislaviensis NBRC 100605]